MNFFGHAIVASKARNSSAELVLGAMLPDFCGMTRSRIRKVSDARIERGIALHHATDAAFHGCDDFVHLSGETTKALSERGVTRGGARAVGHIGIELLLDATLLPDPEGEALYFAALELAATRPFAEFEQESDARVVANMAERIGSYGSPSAHSDPENITNRLVRILAERPRLRLDAHGAAQTRLVLREVEKEVQARSAHLMQELYSSLEKSFEPNR